MKKIWVFTISAFALGFIIGTFSGHRFIPMTAPKREGFSVHQGESRFINPLLECEVGGDDVEFTELKSFRNDLQDLVSSLKTKGWMDFGSVYFRDLANGPWFGINEKEKFTPASLSKVPLMMAYFKEAETNPKVLQHRIEFKDIPDENTAQNLKPSQRLVPGKSYSVDELIRRMIVYSDNNAAMLLNRDVDQKKLVAVFTDLSVPLPIGANENIFTVKQYATFFRMLFNASYLNREMSVKALEILSQTEFRDGIVGGVPPGVPVVHKFGERVYPGKGREKQLHDCGIVYYPEHPYLLCIMTRGDSFEHLDDSIRHISSFVYKNVDDQLRKK